MGLGWAPGVSVQHVLATGLGKKDGLFQRLILPPSEKKAAMESVT